MECTGGETGLWLGAGLATEVCLVFGVAAAPERGDSAGRTRMMESKIESSTMPFS